MADAGLALRAAEAALSPVDQRLLELWRGEKRAPAGDRRPPHPDLLLRRGLICQRLASAVGLLSEEKAMLLLWTAHRVDPEQLARRTGISVDALMRRQRALSLRIAHALGVADDDVFEALTAVAGDRRDASPAASPSLGTAATRPLRSQDRPMAGGPLAADLPMPATPAPHADGTTRRRAGRLRRVVVPERARLMLMCAVAAMVASVAAQLAFPPHYHAVALLAINPVKATDPNFAGVPILRAATGDPSSARTTAQSFASDAAVASLAAQRLGPAWSPATVSSHVAVAAAPNANIVSITASADSAAAAIRVANTYSQAALDIRREQVVPAIRAALVAAGSQLNQPATGAASPTSSPGQRYAAIASLVGHSDPSMTLARRAVTATRPARRHELELAAIAALFGLILGGVAGSFGGGIGRRFQDESVIPQVTGLPVIASFRLSRSELPFGTAALRRLHRLLTASSSGPRRIAFVGLGDGDGTTSIATALAIELARDGRSVTLIDLDWATWTAHRRLGLEFEISAARLSAVASEIAGLPQRPSPLASGLTVKGVFVGAGVQATAAAIAEAAATADYVIVDAPPAARMAGTLGVLAAADVVILVASVGRTTDYDLVHLRDALVGAGARPASIVAIAGSPFAARVDDPVRRRSRALRLRRQRTGPLSRVTLSHKP